MATFPAVAVIDYGRGNIHSVSKALAYLGARPVLTGQPEELMRHDLAVLPGVGAFADAMERLRAAGLNEALCDFVRRGGYLLGICLGMQVLLEEGLEGGGTPGLGFIPGDVRTLPAADLKLPHVGWNSVTFARPSQLSVGLGGRSYFYFVHSYAAYPECEADCIGLTDYGGQFASAVQRGNVLGTQFHPEKSGPAGLRLLANFLHMGGGRVRC